MLTNINIANALATVAANVDGSFTTQDNLIFASGTATGAAIFNVGTKTTAFDAFTGTGAIAYDTANNHFYAADGSSFTFAQNSVNATVTLVAQGNTGGTLDLNSAGISITPDVGDGSLALIANKSGSTFSVVFDGTGTINLGANGIITIPKDFSLNIASNSYTGIPLVGNIHGDGVNDVYATLVNGSQIALISNGIVSGNFNLVGIPINNMTLSGTVVFDPLNNTLTFAQGSSLGVDLGARHINFTATDTAGGQFTFGANGGLTFKTAGGDGGLIMSVTENGVTRQTALNVVGEVTYFLDGSITLGAGTTVTNTWASGASLAITSNTGGGAMVHLTEDGLQVTSTNPEAITAAFNINEVNIPLTNVKLAGTATYNSGDIILSAGSTLTGTNSTGLPMIFTASGADSTVSLGNDSIPNITISTQGQCTAIFGNQIFIVNHGSRISNSLHFSQISSGTDFITNTADTVILNDVGVYAVNGTFITNYVAGSTIVSNADGSIVYNGVTYAAGQFAIDAAGNGIGVVTSADLAGDCLPNYDNDFNNALLLTDAGTNMFDTQQLNALLPSDMTSLGEISFDTQLDKLSNPQLVIVPNDK